MDSHFCTIENIDHVLEEHILDPAFREFKKEMADGIDETMREMVGNTKGRGDKSMEAPVDGGKWEPVFHPHRKGGTFKKAITWRKRDYPMGHEATWYVKSPEYRLTHLLVHGHEHFLFGTPTGKRTEASPFLLNARNKAAKDLVPNIEKRIEGRTK